VELHERAHLLDAFSGGAVARLMAQVPPAPGPGVAADGPDQHFAEMASEAWQLVTEPANVCVEGTPLERLQSAEARAPGTAGFVLRFLEHPVLAASPGAEALRSTALPMVASTADAWAEVWRVVDERRNPDGTLTPWPAPTVRSLLEAQRISESGAGRWIDRVAAIALMPSLAIVRMLDAVV
jgi:hypothetical protein